MFRWGGGKSSKFLRNDIRSLRVGVIVRAEWLKLEVYESMGGKVKEPLLERTEVPVTFQHFPP